MRDKLETLIAQILRNSLGGLLKDFYTLAADHHLTREMMDLNQLSADYQLMLSYYRQGFSDPMREHLYDQLISRLWVIANRMMVEAVALVNRSFKEALGKAMADGYIQYGEVCGQFHELDQQVAMASLEADADNALKTAYSRQHTYRTKLFSSIYTSGSITEQEAAALTEAATSPLTSRTDAQVIVSALMLAQQEIWDIQKFCALCDIVRLSPLFHIRTRALAAMLMTLPEQENILSFYDESISMSLSLLFATPGIQDEIIEMQILMLQAMNTDQTSREISSTIMPFLVKNSAANFMKKKSEEEKIEDILHPDKEEKDMEEVELYMDRMRSLHDKGADIFYGGMKETKRAPFFYTLVNWFLPFYREHPQLRQTVQLPEKYIETITKNGAFFCDSDLYSFYIALQQTIGMLPTDIREMLEDGEVRPELGEKLVDDTCRRRRCMQDLYRFYTLYPNKRDFHSPFETVHTVLFVHKQIIRPYLDLRPYAYALARQLYRCGFYNQVLFLEPILDFRKISHIRLLMLTYAAMEYYDEAQKCAEDILNLTPGDERTEEKLAEYILLDQMQLETKDTEAISRAQNFFYKRLFADEGNVVYVLRVAECQLLQHQYEKAQKTLFSVPAERCTYRMHILRCFLLVMAGENRKAILEMQEVLQKHQWTVEEQHKSLQQCLWLLLEKEVPLLPEVLDCYADVEIIVDLVSADAASCS